MINKNFNFHYTLFIIFTFLLLVACEDPSPMEEIAGEWRFLRRDVDLSVVSDIDQFFILPQDAEGSFSVRGDYEWELNQFMMWGTGSSDSTVFLFYDGTPWTLAPPQLTITITENATVAKFKYDAPSDTGEDTLVNYYSENINFSYNLANGSFELPLTTFQNNTGVGEVTIGGTLDFDGFDLQAHQPKVVFQSSSTHNTDGIEYLSLDENGALCADFYGISEPDTLCGNWEIEGNTFIYTLSNKRYREYTFSIEKDTLILQEQTYCDESVGGSGWLWVVEHPESINQMCSQTRFSYYRE